LGGRRKEPFWRGHFPKREGGQIYSGLYFLIGVPNLGGFFPGILLRGGLERRGPRFKASLVRKGSLGKKTELFGKGL